jgi:hypothetical protein
MGHQVNSCRKVPIQVTFFRWRHFALLSFSLSFYACHSRKESTGTERTRTIYTVFHCMQVTNFCNTKVFNKKICVWMWVFLEDGVAGLNRYKYSVTEHWLTHYPFYYLILCRLLPIWFLIKPPGKWESFSAARKNSLHLKPLKPFGTLKLAVNLWQLVKLHN